jgi:hypothetical protein
LAPEKSGFEKKRSSIGLIGALKIRILEKEVINRSDWRRENQDFEKKRSSIGLIGARKIRIREKEVNNKPHW